MIPFIICALLDSILAKNFLYQSVDTAIRMIVTRNIITKVGIEKTVDMKADKNSDTMLSSNAECERRGARIGRAWYYVKRDSYVTVNVTEVVSVPTSSPGSSRFPSRTTRLDSYCFFLPLSFKPVLEIRLSQHPREAVMRGSNTNKLKPANR